MTQRIFPLIALFAALLMAVPGWAQTATDKEPPTIAAQGEGRITVKPDVARLIIGIRSQAKDVGSVVQTNAVQMDTVLKAVRALGVSDDDIRTVTYSLYPEYASRNPANAGGLQTNIIVGYNVVNVAEVTVRKIADAGRVLDTATKAGANEAGNITFGLSDAEEQKAYSAALAKAVADAKQKIIAIASAANAGALALYSITEGGSADVPGPRPMFAGRGVAEAATPVSAGQLTVTATVTMKYTFTQSMTPNYDKL